MRINQLVSNEPTQTGYESSEFGNWDRVRNVLEYETTGSPFLDQYGGSEKYACHVGQ